MKRAKILVIYFFYILSLFLFTDIYTVFLHPLNIGEEISENFGDAILVLGGGLKKGNKIGLSTEERLALAVRLYKKKRRKIIVSDGSLYRHSPAIKTVMDFLISLGVKKSDIIFEGKSQTTFDNLILTKNIIEDNRLKEIIVCTSPYHQKRTKAMIDYLKMSNYKVVKMNRSEIFNAKNFFQKIRNIKLIIREYISYLKFKIKKR